MSYLLNNLSTTHIIMNIRHIPANTHSIAGSVYGSELELFFAEKKKNNNNEIRLNKKTRIEYIS